MLGYRLGSCLLSHGEGGKASVRWEVPQSSQGRDFNPRPADRMYVQSLVSIWSSDPLSEFNRRE